MIGVAAIVPTEFSSMMYPKQMVYRTWILGALACLWIQAQMQTAREWMCIKGANIRLRIGDLVRLGVTGMVSSSHQRPSRSGRGGRGGRTGPTSRGQGSTNRSMSNQRPTALTPGISEARHYNNLGGRTPIGTPDRERLESYTGQMTTGYS